MRKQLHTVALMAAAGVMLAIPAIGQANRPDANGVHNHPTGTGKSCQKHPTVKKGFVVKGTLVSYNAGAPATGDEVVRITVTGQNKHAKRAGITDADTSTAGTQYELKSADDPFKVELLGYEGTDTPSVGDKVRVIGKVPVERKKCFPGKSLEDRYGDANVRTVKIIDSDPDTP